MTNQEYQIEEEQPEGMPEIPHNRQAEESVVGSVLIDPNKYWDVSIHIKPESFYIHSLRFIWEAIIYVTNSPLDVDLLTVADRLAATDQLVDIGGRAFLTSLVNIVPTSYHAETYAKTVSSYYARRKVLEAANTMATDAYNLEKPIEEVLSDVGDEMRSTELLSTSNHNMRPIGELLAENIEQARERAKDPQEVWGLDTGFPKFNKRTGGIHKAELVYVVGPPGVGKSWLMTTWAESFGKQEPGAIISLEMKNHSVSRRILSGVSAVSTTRMRSGFLDDRDFRVMESKLDRFKDNQIFIDDSGYDTNKLRVVLREMKRDYGIGWFILDYAMLLTDKGKDETEQTKIISANLKRVVSDLDLAGIVLHSVVKVGMSKDGDNARPKMSDQRGSGQAIHDPDVQLFLTPLYEGDNLELKNLPKEQKKKMITLWSTKAREVENAQFMLALTRKGDSPFFGEYSPMREERQEAFESPEIFRPTE